MDTPTLKVNDGTEMRGHVARPDAAVKKGIIIIQEAFGVNDYIRRVAQRFADKGYLAIAPELFHRTSSGFEADYVRKEGVEEQMHALTDQGISADIKASFEWLVSQGIPENKIAVLGFCMGGRAAFLANADLPVAASISFYGGGIAQSLLPRAADLHGPQLLIWGGRDEHIWPEHSRAVAAALFDAKRHYIDITFSEAGHGFACDARESYRESSAREAWALVDEFLATHLV